MRSGSLAVLLTLGVLLGATGCSGKVQDEGPVTFKVTGKVVYADGRPYPGGVIEFNSTMDTTIRAVSRISSEGEFSLRSSVTRGDLKPGAPASSYRATITPDQGNTQQGAPPIPVVLPDIYTVQENDNNNFTIIIPKR